MANKKNRIERVMKAVRRARSVFNVPKNIPKVKIPTSRDKPSVLLGL